MSIVEVHSTGGVSLITGTHKPLHQDKVVLLEKEEKTWSKWQPNKGERNEFEKTE